MSLRQASIERAFSELHERARRVAGVEREFQATRGAFLGPAGEPRNREMAERRHAEWFLLERASDALEAAPVAAFTPEVEAQGERELELGHAALLGSFASVFEITGVSPGEGVWLRDLAGLGEYPLEEPDASRALEAGDMLVGRVFPVGDALYRISHASGFFRDERLLAAVRQDLERARAERRGVVRLSQRELESMFFGVPLAGAHATGAADAVKSNGEASEVSAVDAARRLLALGGLEASEIEDVLAELASEPYEPEAVLPGAGDRLGEILARLAFETDVDLELARRALALAWPELSAPPAPARPAPPAPARPRASKSPRRRTSGVPEPRVERALSEFDARRAAGADLDTLFADLEAQLELDSRETADEDPAPDFPGVVGAMVIEFLWDIERERGPEAARELAPIANFAAYAQHLGVFENLGERDLLLYTCLWLPERALSGEDAARSFRALLEFSQWAEERHEVRLASALAPTRDGLAQALPRVAEANVRLRAWHGPLREGGEMLGFEGGRVARTPRGEEREISLPKEAAGSVEPGDFLRAEPSAGAPLRVVCIYPPQTARLGELA